MWIFSRRRPAVTVKAMAEQPITHTPSKNPLRAGSPLSAALCLSLAASLAACGSSDSNDFESEIGSTVTLVRDADGVRLWSYVTPAEFVSSSTYVVESENRLVLFDSHLTIPASRDFRAFVDSLGKPIDRLFITHSHPDHHMGAATAFSDVPLYTADRVIPLMEFGAQSRLDQLEPVLGADLLPENVRIPDNGVSDGQSVEIDGVTYEFSVVAHAEDHWQLITRIPALRAASVGDLSYSGDHLFLGVYFDGWRAVLQDLLADRQIDTFLAGHGGSGGPEILQADIAYLEAGKQAYAEADTAEELQTALEARFPDRGGEAIFQFYSPFLFPKSQARAAIPGVEKGSVVTRVFDGLVVHTYLAGEDSNLDATHVFESENKLVVIDTQFLTSYAKEFRAFVDALSLPVERVFVSHAHPDHYWGLSAAFTDLPTYALQASIDSIDAQEPGLRDSRVDLGDERPETIALPRNAVTPGDTVIDGITYRVSSVADAEADVQMQISVDEYNIEVLQDLCYNKVHLFTAANRDNWKAILGGIERSKLLLCGHGEPFSTTVIAENLDYLDTANSVIGAVDNAQTCSADLASAHPDHRGSLHQLSCGFLFPAP